ncbi:MAG: phosphate/phosphite/phosphonate ABC transporter substrate-binding protein [Clostridium sp.]
MKFKKIGVLIMALVMTVGVASGLAGCGETAKESKEITIVWYPNESGGDFEEARKEVGNIVEKATGKKVQHKTTTDYAVAIETISSNNAAISFMGAQGYVEANKKNPDVVPLVVPSGKSGTLDDAVYYSWLAVPKDKANDYKVDGKYTIDNIKGKKMSYVSPSSTSGFKVPTSGIISYFSKKDATKDIKVDDLNKSGGFFSEVLYGNSHQGSAVNLLSGKVDVAAFCDTVLVNYIEASSGEFNKLGTTYKVKAGATEPFNNLIGKEFTTIANVPVLNSPFVMNKKVLSETDQKKLLEAFTSDEVTKNEKIFVPKGANFKGFFAKEGKEQFLKVEDKWFDPVRDLSK